jgi:hypothetical protein
MEQCKKKKGATYAAVLAGDIALQEPIGPLKPTAMDSDPSEFGPIQIRCLNRDSKQAHV